MARDAGRRPWMVIKRASPRVDLALPDDMIFDQVALGRWVLCTIYPSSLEQAVAPLGDVFGDFWHGDTENWLKIQYPAKSLRCANRWKRLFTKRMQVFRYWFSLGRRHRRSCNASRKRLPPIENSGKVADHGLSCFIFRRGYKMNIAHCPYTWLDF